MFLCVALRVSTRANFFAETIAPYVSCSMTPSMLLQLSIHGVNYFNAALIYQSSMGTGIERAITDLNRAAGRCEMKAANDLSLRLIGATPGCFTALISRNWPFLMATAMTDLFCRSHRSYRVVHVFSIERYTTKQQVRAGRLIGIVHPSR